MLHKLIQITLQLFLGYVGREVGNIPKVRFNRVALTRGTPISVKVNELGTAWLSFHELKTTYK